MPYTTSYLAGLIFAGTVAAAGAQATEAKLPPPTCAVVIGAKDEHAMAVIIVDDTKGLSIRDSGPFYEGTKQLATYSVKIVGSDCTLKDGSQLILQFRTLTSAHDGWARRRDLQQ